MSGRVGRGERVYDALLKRVFEKASEVVFKVVLGVNVDEVQELPRELVRVKEQKVEEERVDFLVWVNTGKTKRVLYHVEFQSTNDPWMHQRLIHYNYLLERKYGVFPEQVVIYLGREQLQMTELLERKGEHTRYSHYCMIVDLHKLDPQELLSCNDPLVALLSLISDVRPVHETLKEYVNHYHDQVTEQLETYLTQ